MMDWHYANQELRKQDLAEKVAERNRYALAGRRLSLRARAARVLFALAVAVEKQEARSMAREG